MYVYMYAVKMHKKNKKVYSSSVKIDEIWGVQD